MLSCKSVLITTKPRHEKCANREDSDQPAHARSQIRIFPVHINVLSILENIANNEDRLNCSRRNALPLRARPEVNYGKCRI